MTRPTPILTLSMIVKNEAATIARTLASAKPFVDRWVIVDTGSTDGTEDAVRHAMEGTPGELHEAPFVDFATARNHALELCGVASEFVLWLDADDELVGGRELRAYLEKERSRRAPDREAYYVRIEVPGAAYDSARVVRSSAGWRFRGAVHEVLCRADRAPPAHRVSGVAIRHRPDRASAERSKKRWERDVELLRAAVAREPDDTRSTFYLGLTLVWLGRLDEAKPVLERRIALGGWIEEVYYARMQLAGIASAQGEPWPIVLEAYLEAHTTLPHRGEPLHAIALHYNALGAHALCLLFARRGYELPRPTEDHLFVDEAVYDYKLADLVASSAYWVGAFELGEEAARRALGACPGDVRLAQNLEHYLARKRRGR